MVLMNAVVDWRTGVGKVGGKGTEGGGCLEPDPALHSRRQRTPGMELKNNETKIISRIFITPHLVDLI